MTAMLAPNSISTHTPLAGRDEHLGITTDARIIISTHTPLAGRDRRWRGSEDREGISTHTPLAGRDGGVYGLCREERNFYSHAPRGARQKWIFNLFESRRFLLTRPSRGATDCRTGTDIRHEFLLTRPSRGATRYGGSGKGDCRNFYSHAPRGARLLWNHNTNIVMGFLLTRPSRGAT